jgi:DNA-binding beta-propeller fold protein YncE
MRDASATHNCRRYFEPASLALAASLVFLVAGCSHIQPQASAVPQRPPLEFIGQWGVSGVGPGQLANPVGPAVDGFGRVYLINPGSGLVQKFQADGSPLLSFDDDGARHASSLAVDSGGGIYVANAPAGEMRIFFPEGDLLRSFRVAPERTSEGPFGFSIAADGTVFVPDASGGRIQALSSQGKLERVWRVPPAAGGKASKPVAAEVGPDGFVYVADFETGRIVKFTRDGMQVASWDDSVDPPAPLLGLAVSSSYVFVLRGASPRIVVWTLAGQMRVSDNLAGRLDAAPRNAGSLAVSPSGELVVLDPAAPRVLRFRIHL